MRIAAFSPPKLHSPQTQRRRHQAFTQVGERCFGWEIHLSFVLLLSPSPPLPVGLWIETVDWTLLQLRQKHTFLLILYRSHVYLLQATGILSPFLPILTKPIKSWSVWYNFAVPHVLNHSKGPTHKTANGVEVNGGRQQFLSPFCIYIPSGNTDMPWRYFVTEEFQPNMW